MALREWCPVCGESLDSSDRRCRVCRWEREEGFVLGEVTQEAKTRYETRLRRAKEEWEQRVSKSLDLLLMLDRIGDSETIQARRVFMEQLLEELMSVLPRSVTCRVALVAFGDRNHLSSLRTKKHPSPLQVWDFDSPSGIPSALQEVEPLTGELQDLEAAVEEALAALPRLHWSRRSRRVLLTLGSRPPHPLKPEPGLRQIGSEAGQDWRELVTRARVREQILSIAVECPLYWPSSSSLPEHAVSYSATFWRELGYTARFKFGAVSPSAIAQSIVLTLPLRTAIP